MNAARIYVADVDPLPVGGFAYTAFCAFPDTPPGQHDYALDIFATGPYRPGVTAIRRVAQAELDAYPCEPGLRVRRIRRTR